MCNGRQRLIIPILLGLAAMAASAGDEAADNGPPLGSRNCIDADRIRNTKIIDDSTIVFYMQGGQVFVNHLPHRCSGLRVAGSFGYKTRVRQLCNVDIITVVRSGGVGMRGPSCGLGMFTPISAEDVGLLGAEPEPETESEDVLPEIKPPEEGEGEDED